MRHDLNELLQEVEQDRLKDQIFDMWQKWGNWILVGIAALIIGSAGWNIYQYAQTNHRTKIADQFESGRQALENKQEDKGKSILEKVATSNVVNYRAMARLALADFFVRNKRNDQAYQQFKLLEQDTAVRPFYRGLATLNRIRLDFDNKKDPKQLLSEIDTLMTSNAMLRLPALELKAFLLAQTKEYGKARDIFVEIAQSPQSDPQIRKRAHAMVRFITVKYF